MADNKSKIDELNQMVLSGKALEAFDRFYADDVVMQENDQAPTVGKAANRAREIAFFGAITEFRGAKILAVAGAGDKTFVEWHNDYAHKEWGDRRYHQVAVQTWKDGKIVHERFYYGSSLQEPSGQRHLRATVHSGRQSSQRSTWPFACSHAAWSAVLRSRHARPGSSGRHVVSPC
jgi:hypothetical protein